VGGIILTTPESGIRRCGTALSFVEEEVMLGIVLKGNSLLASILRCALVLNLS
jgi:hypothetical protein